MRIRFSVDVPIPEDVKKIFDNIGITEDRLCLTWKEAFEQAITLNIHQISEAILAVKSGISSKEQVIAELERLFPKPRFNPELSRFEVDDNREG